MGVKMTKKSKKEEVTIKIPRELYKNLQKVIENTGFSCVTDFLVFTMREVASMGHVKSNNIPFDEAEAVKEKLRALGYIK
jgi:hypothetical protein